MTGFFVPPGANIIDVLADMLMDVKANLPDQRVLFSGRRPAHFLRQALAQKLNRAYVPPPIHSINDFISEFMKEEEVIGELEASVLLSELLGKLKYKPQPPLQSNELERYTLARQLFDEFEELKFEKITPAQLSTACSSAPMPLLWYAESFEKFYAELNKRALYSLSMAYEHALVRMCEREVFDYGVLYICDWIPQTRLEQEVLNALASSEPARLLYFDTPQTRSLLSDSGIDFSGWDSIERAASARRTPSVSFYHCGDRHSQLFALNAELEKLNLSTGLAPHQVLIVLPKPDLLIPAMKHSLATLPRDSYNISMGYPLNHSTLFGFFVLLKILFEFRTPRGFRKQDVLSFIRHPYVKTFSANHHPTAARILSQTLLGFLGDRLDIEFIEFETLMTDPDLRQAFREAESRYIGGGKQDVLLGVLKELLSQFLGQIHSSKTLPEMTKALLFAADTIYTSTAAPSHPLFARWYSTFRSGCAEIVDTFEENKIVGETTLLLQFVLEFIGGQTCAFPGTPLSGAQVLGFLETRSLSFDTVFFIDANDDVLPGRPARPVGLFEALRASLKVKSNERKRLIQEHHFNRLRSAAKRVHYFYVENDELDRSRFIEKFVWNRQREVLSLDALTPELSVTMNMNLANSEPGLIPKSEEQIEVLNNIDFSATMLDTYLDCQRRFYFKYVAAIGEPTDQEDEAAPPDVGNLVHSILREYFTPLLSKELETDDLDESRMIACIENVFQSRYGEGVLGGKFLIKERIKVQLKNYVAYCRDAVSRGTSTKILALEEKLQAIMGGHRFIGRLDRVERRGKDIWIEDYKTGKSTALSPNWERFDEAEFRGWRDSLRSLQMVLYALLIKHNGETFPGNPVPAYIALGAVPFTKDAEIKFFPDEFSQDVIEKMVFSLEAGLVEIVNEIKDIQRGWAPPEDIRKQCPGCAYQALCGTQWL